MKKKYLILLLCGAFMCTFTTGCGESSSSTADESTVAESVSEGEIITVDEMLATLGYDVSSYVTLGDYKTLTVDVDESSYEVTDEQVEAEIEYYAMDYPAYETLDKDTVEDGDLVDIAYKGTIDGEEFDGGTSDSYVLTIGSGEFIEGFEEGLIGKKVGETLTLPLQFPEDYSGDESIDGKDVDFEVTIHAIVAAKEITSETITDEYVAEYVQPTLDLATVEEFKAYIKEDLIAQAEENKNSEIQNLLLEKLIEISEVNIPDELIESEITSYKASMEETAASYEMEFEDFLTEYYGYESWEATEEYLKENIPEQMKQYMVLDALMIEFNTEVSSSELEDMYGMYAMMYGYDDFDAFCEEYGGKAAIALSYAEDQALSQLASELGYSN